MAYDRYDRDERSRWSNDRSDRDSERSWREQQGTGRGGRDERGFWDRASDEVASWFGDDDAERRRRHDNRSPEHRGADRDRGWSPTQNYREQRHMDRDQSSFGGSRSDREFNYDRGVFNRGGSSDSDWNRDREPERGRLSGGYRPLTGDYGRSEHESDQFFAASGYGRGQRGLGDYDRSQTPYGRDDYRRTSFAGSRREERDEDPHYRNWRDRHMSDLDRDYDDYRREHQSKFENDFTSWREKRQQKRGLLGQVREHMEVVGSDGEHVGTVDKTAGDRIILTKSDPESGGAHHSLTCSNIDRVEGDKVILDCSADDARKHWRDESRSRALFEREDSGEMGPGVLDQSFSGTYR